MRRLTFGSWLVLPALAVACSTTDNGTLQILTTEPNTFTGPPAVAKLTVQAVDSTGNATTLATASLPASTIDLGKHDETTVASIEVKGTDANGIELVSGRSLPVQFRALAGGTLPLFVQRVGHLVPLPGGPMSDSRQSPIISPFQGQYLFVGGGSPAGASSELYDFLSFTPLPSPPTLPRTPASVAFIGPVALLIDAAGAATYFDFSGNYAPYDLPPLAGGSFADVAGGATVISDLDGTEFIVGATRLAGTPTSAVLQINPSDTSNSNYPLGNLTWLTSPAKRLAASATWVGGRGLVVAGGNATASGAELFSSRGSPANSVSPTASPLPFPPDASVGTGATALDTQTVLLAGGITPDFHDAGARTLDVSCASSCTPKPWVSAFPFAIVGAQAFTLGPADGFVVGNAPLGGATHAYRLSSTTATEVPTAVPHTNARAAWSPVGSIVLVGGAHEFESFLF
jgi:hypothetical protein